MLRRCQFADGWYQADVDNAENFMLNLGYVIMYVGYTALW